MIPGFEKVDNARNLSLTEAISGLKPEPDHHAGDLSKVLNIEF